MGKRKGRGNMAANRAVIRVHTGDSFIFDDKRDLQFLTLLSDEIQDDQVNVITEGLQLQKALASSLMVFDPDEIDEDENSDEKLSPESASILDDSAAGEEIRSFLEKDPPLIFWYSDDSTDEDENSAGKSALETAIFSADSAENRAFMEKALHSSLKVTDSGDTDEEIIAAAKSSADTASLIDDSAAEEKNCSFLEKSRITSFKIGDSDCTGEVKNSAPKSSPETALIPDHTAAEEENWSFVEKSQLASLKITDSDNTGEGKNSAAKSPPQTALIPDHSAAQDENRPFVEKSRLKSLKITDSAVTGKVKNDAAAKSWPKPLPDDFTPKNQNWAFLNEFCELCTVEDKLRRLIRVSGCGHYFCNYCFEWYTSTELGSEQCYIKCPAETCSNQIESDHCVALMLQHSLDSRGESISDWEFLDSQNLP